VLDTLGLENSVAQIDARWLTLRRIALKALRSPSSKRLEALESAFRARARGLLGRRSEDAERMRQWRNRVERLEDVIASASLLLRFRNGSTELLPIGSEIDLLIDLLR